MAFTMHRPAGGPELSVVVPTFNERDNIELLLARREAALCGIEWEVIYVDDDSSDGIAHKVRSLAQAKFAHPRCPADRPPGLVLVVASTTSQRARHTWRSSMPTSSMTRRRSRECSAPSKNKTSM